jgi:hypothetical protein
LKVVLVSVPNCPRGLPSSCEIARCQLLVYPHVGLHGANVGQPYMLCNRISECQVPQLPTPVTNHFLPRRVRDIACSIHDAVLVGTPTPSSKRRLGCRIRCPDSFNLCRERVMSRSARRACSLCCRALCKPQRARIESRMCSRGSCWLEKLRDSRSSHA